MLVTRLQPPTKRGVVTVTAAVVAIVMILKYLGIAPFGGSPIELGIRRCRVLESVRTSAVYYE